MCPSRKTIVTAHVQIKDSKKKEWRIQKTLAHCSTCEIFCPKCYMSVLTLMTKSPHEKVSTAWQVCVIMWWKALQKNVRTSGTHHQIIAIFVCLVSVLFFCYLIPSCPLPSKHPGLQFLLRIYFVEFVGALIANMHRYTNLGVLKQRYQAHTRRHTYELVTTPHTALTQ